MEPPKLKGTRTRFFNSCRRLLMFPPAERLISVFTRRKSRSALAWKFVPPEVMYPKASMRMATRHGILYALDLSNFNDHSVFFGEPTPSLDYLYGMIKADFVVLDAGANIGLTTLNFALRSPRGKVYGYEPHPSTFEKLQKNILLNRFRHIEIFRKALGEKQGFAAMTVPEEHNSGMNRILPGPLTASGLNAVEVSTIDHEVQRLSLRRLDLIKIDVEGFELQVIKGGLETLQQFKPILYIELIDKNLAPHGHHAGELVTMLRDLGYGIMDCMTQRPIEFVRTGMETDILCIPN